jgi:hypothetical protein
MQNFRRVSTNRHQYSSGRNKLDKTIQREDTVSHRHTIKQTNLLFRSPICYHVH